jgi:RING finger protein 113A
MFRKPKKNATKAGLRRKRNDDEGDNHEEDDETSRELAEARKQAAGSKRLKGNNIGDSDEKTKEPSSSSSGLLHQFEASQSGPMSQKEQATRTNELHPTKVVDRGNKFLAGPIKAPTNIRTTCRFDYQPDICKDYKDTGFCGFGDTCIYLHDRGDTLSGWQLEQQWQQEQEVKKKKQQEQMDAFIIGANGNKTDKSTSSAIMDEDGIPFACHVCRNHFTDPVVTNCGHYFCQSCILAHVKESSSLCPVCNKDTHGVFHEPTKLLSKKRKASGRDSSWKEFQEACQKAKSSDDNEE